MNDQSAQPQTNPTGESAVNKLKELLENINKSIPPSVAGFEAITPKEIKKWYKDTNHNFLFRFSISIFAINIALFHSINDALSLFGFPLDKYPQFNDEKTNLFLAQSISMILLFVSYLVSTGQTLELKKFEKAAPGLKLSFERAERSVRWFNGFFTTTMIAWLLLYASLFLVNYFDFKSLYKESIFNLINSVSAIGIICMYLEIDRGTFKETQSNDLQRSGSHLFILGGVIALIFIVELMAIAPYQSEFYSTQTILQQNKSKIDTITLSLEQNSPISKGISSLVTRAEKPTSDQTTNDLDVEVDNINELLTSEGKNTLIATEDIHTIHDSTLAMRKKEKEVEPVIFFFGFLSGLFSGLSMSLLVGHLCSRIIGIDMLIPRTFLTIYAIIQPIFPLITTREDTLYITLTEYLTISALGGKILMFILIFWQRESGTLAYHMMRSRDLSLNEGKRQKAFLDAIKTARNNNNETT